MKLVVLMMTALFALLVEENDSEAYKLEPISRVFAPAGSGATQTYQLVNSSAERVAVTISFATLELDADHKETNRAADDDFLVYPPQILLEPNSKQTVRVTWLGTPTPATELAYRIFVQQIPIELVDKTAAPTPIGQLKVLMNYRGSLYIRPPAAVSNIVLQSAKVAQDNGRTSLVVTLRNAGTALGLVKGCALQVQTPAGLVDLPAASVASVNGTRLLARQTRRYTLPWPATAESSSPNVSGKCTFTTP